LGFGLAKLGGLAFCALVSNLVGNCHQCNPNEVSKVLLQKELILVGFWLIQVRWIGFFCLGSKIGDKVKSWFFCHLGWEFSQMQPKRGVKSLVAKGIDLGWVLV